MSWLWVSLVVFAAVLIQSLVGFGSAMVAMALLAGALGLGVASPLVALIAFSMELVVLLRYRHALNVQAVWQLVAGALVGVPIGVLALSRIPERTLLPALGIVIGSYALYGLFGQRLPELRGTGWAFGTGALAGILGGAYNTSGPPVIVYGDCQRWPPAQFKSNLQGFFLVSDAIVLAGHAVAGNLTATVWGHYLAALPAVGLALAIGFSLDRRVAPAAFRKLALVVLLILGGRLLLSGL